MKLPRWFLSCLVISSVLAVMAAAGRWWILWPDLTAREFMRQLAAGNEQSWKTLTADNMQPAFQQVIAQLGPSHDWSKFEYEPRSFGDVLSGTRRFTCSRLNLTAQRSRIVGPSLAECELILARLSIERAIEQAFRSFEQAEVPSSNLLHDHRQEPAPN